jgi:protein-S-isoprenylcysteine O-methyltransferase Ste14
VTSVEGKIWFKEWLAKLKSEKEISMKGPLPPVYFLVFIVAMMALHFLWPIIKLLLFPWTILGFIPFVIGAVLILKANRAFKKHQTTVKPFEESSTLVTDGVFRITRNPMYLGLVLILFGIALFMGSLIPFVIIPLFIVLIYRMFIKVEEKMLKEKFGELYLKYKNKVRRWI